MKPTALVVGGTLAGLTAALRLGRHGYAVTLITHHAPRSPDEHRSEDALPLVLMGCHTATASLLDTLGTAHHVSFTGRIRLELLTSPCRVVSLRRPLLPPPLHLIAGLVMFSGMPARDRLRFVMWMERTWERDPALPVDLDGHTAEAWLRGIGQSESARAHVWTPLSRFLLGDDIKTVSAAALLDTLKRCFLSSRRHSQLAMPSPSMEELLYRPLEEAVRGTGASITDARVDRIAFNLRDATGVQLSGGETLTADWYILAVPHQEITPLLPERLLTRFGYFQQIGALADTPVVAVHIRLDQPFGSPRLLLLARRTFHWMCLKPAADPRHTLVSCIITGHGEGVNRSDKELLDLAAKDVRDALPSLSRARQLAHRIIREPRALLSMRPGSAAHRPLQRSPFANLLLAGGWTDTGLPSSVESSILSGDRCARTILDMAAGIGRNTPSMESRVP